MLLLNERANAPVDQPQSPGIGAAGVSEEPGTPRHFGRSIQDTSSVLYHLAIGRGRSFGVGIVMPEAVPPTSG